MDAAQSTLAEDQDADTQPRDVTAKDPRPGAEPDEQETVSAESLIEEVSIDGMCGVY